MKRQARPQYSRTPPRTKLLIKFYILNTCIATVMPERMGRKVGENTMDLAAAISKHTQKCRAGGRATNKNVVISGRGRYRATYGAFAIRLSRSGLEDFAVKVGVDTAAGPGLCRVGGEGVVGQPLLRISGIM